MSKLILLIVLLTCTITNLIGQSIFYQDYFNGGVTGAGFSSGSSNLSANGQIEVQIEPGSIIKKAYLICNRFGNVPPVNINFNGTDYVIDLNSQIGLNYNIGSSNGTHISAVHAIDITTEINANQNVYNLNYPSQLNNGGVNKYGSFYLVILYENNDFPLTALSIIVNDKDATSTVNYQLSNLLPVNSFNPVGLAIHTDIIWDTIVDGSYIYANNNYLGLIGGSDAANSAWTGAGVKGHFYYENNTLFGLDDDTPDNLMGGTDGLANIADLILNNSTSLEIELIKQPTAPYNVYISFFLAYTTPCQPFETTLTEEVAVCRGDSAQLLATGGTSTGSAPAYEWLPQEELSCYDCPNPVFLGDSTRHYTVRIWSTDSCSKVLPVKVLVYDVPTQASLNLNPATCSESNGSVSISNVVGGTPLYIYNIGGNSSTNPNFNNLAPGVYNLQVTDANTCTYNQAFTIEEINPVTAAFSANPQQGVAPLNVNFTNQSTGANLYQWLVNTQTFESFNINYTFDTAGTYPVQLIAYYNEPHCADTALKVVVVENDFSVIIPTVHHSSQYTWGITTSNVVQIKAQVYNAIGQLIHQSQQTANNGPNPIWPADENATGYYFYRLQLTDVEGKEHGYEGKVLVVR
jgi:PKD repeat protein